MNRTLTILSAFTFASLILMNGCKKKDEIIKAPTPVSFVVPQGFPKPAYDLSQNPLTEEGIALGRKLFYEGKLSKDGSFPCASCHQQFAAFATFDHGLSHGVDHTFTSRNAPGIFNMAWLKEYMYDGSINHLDLQPLAPITSPNEMGETIINVIKKLKADATYRNLFRAAFGNEDINTQKMTKALSQFMVTMVSANSKYDQVKKGTASFTLAEGLGYDIFKQKCASCHQEPLFTDLSYRNTGMPLDNVLKDLGRMTITKKAADSLKFKVPSLRNVMMTAPYGHDGRFFAITNVLDHYRNGVVNGPITDPLVKNKIVLSNFEIGQLQAFLQTLTDSSFLKDARFSQPQ